MSCRTVCAALVLVIGVSGAATAGAVSQSEVDPNVGSSVVDNGTSSSSATLDANNYARSFITPGTSIMGAAAATDGSASPTTTTTHQDSWWFNCAPPNTCASSVLGNPIPLALTFGIKVSETQVVDGAYLEFDASYQLQTGGQFNFTFAQDGQGDFELTSNYVTSNGDTVDIPVTQTLANGVWTLTAHTTVQDQICGISSPCIPTEMSCDSGQNCSNPPVFTDLQSITALIDPNFGESDVIDGYDPFTVDITSLDPNYQFVSADGRTIGGAPTVDAPEPGTALLVAGGLIGFWRRRRRAVPRRD